MENIDDVSEIYIGFYDDDCEEEDISFKDQNYTHLEAMEEMDVMRYYMTEISLPQESFNGLNRLHWTALQQHFKRKKKGPLICSFLYVQK